MRFEIATVKYVRGRRQLTRDGYTFKSMTTGRVRPRIRLEALFGHHDTSAECLS
jgi:hypothetical protein